MKQSRCDSPQVARDLLAGQCTLAEAARVQGLSPRAFAAQFRAHWHTTPQALLDWPQHGSLLLHLPAPYDVQRALDHLGRDGQSLSEWQNGSSYQRRLWVEALPLPLILNLEFSAAESSTVADIAVPAAAAVKSRIEAQPEAQAGACCRIEVRSPEADSPPTQSARWRSALWEVFTTVRHVLGLTQPWSEFVQQTSAHPRLGPLIQAMPGLRVIHIPGLWEALVWAILGQQIHLRFAYTLRNRLIAQAVHTAQTAAQNTAQTATPADRSLLTAEGVPHEGIPLPFPTPQQVLRIEPEALRAQQFSRQKTAYLMHLARAFLEDDLGSLSLAKHGMAAIEAKLRRIKGLGPWSVAYGLMRGLGEPDALPVGDAGLKKALQIQFQLDKSPSPSEQTALMTAFVPYRSLATFYLWKSLTLPLESKRPSA